MDALAKFVSTDGRLSRKGYIQLFVLPFAGLIVFTWLSWVALPDFFGGMPAILFIAPWLAFFFSADAQNIKRWHDLGNSGALYRMARPFLFILPIIAVIFQFMLPNFFAMSGDVGALMFLIGQQTGGFSFGPVPMALFAITLAGAAFNIVYLTIMPGKSGPNEYGPNAVSSGFVPGVATSAAKSENDDPVQRALAAYQAEQKKRATPAAAPQRPGQAAAATFGRKRI